MISNDMNEKETLEKFISDQFDGIGYLNKSVDYDEEGKIINVSYRLMGDIIISLTKPYETLDDNFVAFNVYQDKTLLISEIADCKLILTYLHNVNEKVIILKKRQSV